VTDSDGRVRELVTAGTTPDQIANGERRRMDCTDCHNRPSHVVYAVTKTGERNFWNVIGAAWVHSDGWGFNVKIDYLPLNGAEIVIRKPKIDEADATATD